MLRYHAVRLAHARKTASGPQRKYTVHSTWYDQDGMNRLFRVAGTGGYVPGIVSDSQRIGDFAPQSPYFPHAVYARQSGRRLTVKRMTSRLEGTAKFKLARLALAQEQSLARKWYFYGERNGMPCSVWFSPRSMSVWRYHTRLRVFPTSYILRIMVRVVVPTPRAE